MAEIITSGIGPARWKLELHVGDDGLALKGDGRADAAQFAPYSDVESINASGRGRRLALTIAFTEGRAPWLLPSVRAAEADWAVRMIRDRLTAARRRSDRSFNEPLPFSEFPSRAQGFTAEAERGSVDIVDFLLMQGVLHGASDVHFEPYQKELLVRFRIDGMLHDVLSLPRESQDQLGSRLKVISRLTVYRRDIPQEGRIALPLDGRTVDFRLTALPTIHGEKFTARIFDPARELFRIEDLGMDPETQERFMALISQPQGTILLTGPSNSGKTTTMYAALRRLRETRRSLTSIATVEDPVEYDLQVLNQTQVNPRSGLTFAAALRTVLRQDPEVIMVGEIRDPETAEIAIQAGLTGHLILSTVHARSAAGVLLRLLDLGIEPFLLASSVDAVLAQRLVRKLCGECKGQGCPRCESTSYAGRTAVFQLVVITDEMREMVLKRASLLELEHAVKRSGAPSLRDAATARVREGVTTEAEVARVLGEPV